MDLTHRLVISDELIESRTCFAANTYARNLVCRTGTFELLVLCWKPGHESTIHDHAGSLNAIRVHRGELTSRIFVPAAGRPVGTRSRSSCSPRSACSAAAGPASLAAASISCSTPPREDLVTVHVYAPPLTELVVYSTDTAATERRRSAPHARRRPGLTRAGGSPPADSAGGTRCHFPRARSARAASRSRPSASAPGRPAAAAGRSAGGRRTTTCRSPPSAAPWTSASTGSTRRRSTAWGTRRRWWGGPCGLCPPPPARSLFTKCGLEWDPADRMRAAERVVTPRTVRHGIEDSLRRLGVDTVDLFQIHWPDDQGNPVEEAWAEMVKVRAEGKARAIGVSNFGAELLARIEPIGHVDTLQPPFSLIQRETAARAPPLGAGARHRCALLQPDGVGHPHRHVQRRPGRRLWPRTTGAGDRRCSTSRS